MTTPGVSVYRFGAPTAMERHRWLCAVPYWKEYAKPGETFPPPEDDMEKARFVDDMLRAARNMVGGAAIDMWPTPNNRGAVLRRTLKKKTDDGRDNPNYARWYLVSADPGVRFFQWLTESMWWRSYMHKRCLSDDWIFQLEAATEHWTGPEGLWGPAFREAYETQVNHETIALKQLPHPAGSPVLGAGSRFPSVTPSQGGTMCVQCENCGRSGHMTNMCTIRPRRPLAPE